MLANEFVDHPKRKCLHRIIDTVNIQMMLDESTGSMKVELILGTIFRILTFLQILIILQYPLLLSLRV